jgi:hypothetical protein
MLPRKAFYDLAITDHDGVERDGTDVNTKAIHMKPKDRRNGAPIQAKFTFLSSALQIG